MTRSASPTPWKAPAIKGLSSTALQNTTSVMASSSVGGLSGAFIPVSEDEGMIAAAQSGALTLDKLEAMTCVCSVGLDTGLGLYGAGENRDGVGYLPDLWVEPSKALDAVERLIEASSPPPASRWGTWWSSAGCLAPPP